MCGSEKLQANYLIKTIKAYEETALLYTSTWFDNPVMEPMLDRFLSFLEDSSDVLDAGCGPGRDVLAMGKKGFDAVGVDLCYAMLKEAREKVPNGTFRRMDMRQLSYPPETFDGIWCCISLNNLRKQDVRLTLKEFCRVLASGGMLSLIVEEGQSEFVDQLGRHWYLYTSADIRSLLTESGFYIVEEYGKCCEIKKQEENHSKKVLQILARKTAVVPDSMDVRYGYNCVFCPASRFELHKEIGIPGVSSVLWGDNDLYILPDAAPLIEGHLLMVTVRHYMCFGACPTALTSSIYNTQRYIRQLFQRAYKEPTVFLEHGPARPREAGSCIDHAHWHCLPDSSLVRSTVEKLVGPGKRANLDTLRSLHQSGESYLYVEEGNNKGWVYEVDVAPAQFLRQVVASRLGNGDWQWQTICKTTRTQNIYHNTIKHLLPLADELCSPQRSVRGLA